MAIKIISQLTTASYPPDGATVGAALGPSTLGLRLDLIVGNAPVLATIATAQDKKAGPLAGYQWTDDIPLAAGTGQIVSQSFDGGLGFKAKDLVPGLHATVYAIVWEKGDPVPTPAANYLGSLSASGSAAVVTGITGGVNANGTIAAGTGFTVNHSGTGTYVVSWNTPFANTPLVLVTPINGAVICTANGPGINNVTVMITDHTGSPVDNSFNFLAELFQ